MNEAFVETIEELWDASRHRDPSELPSVGEIMELITEGGVDGRAYDESYPARIRETLY